MGRCALSDSPSWPVWVDGELREPGAPAIAAEDPGYLLGRAVFETLLCDGGRLEDVDEHLERLREGATALGIEPPPEELLRRGLEEVRAALGERRAALRMTLSPGAPGAGPRLALTTRAAEIPPPDGVAVLLVERAKVAGHFLEGLKTTSRVRNVLALEAARAAGCAEALLGSEEGDFVEGTVSNLFAVRDGVLLTPALGRGCLPGIGRRKVLEAARRLGLEVVEGRVERADLAEAEEVFLTSSTVRVLPVTEVRGLRDDLPRGGGALTRRLQRAVEPPPAAPEP